MACAGTPQPGSVVGTETGLAALDGPWSGEYWGGGAGRGGSIVFEVKADSHSAPSGSSASPRGA
jgi:hypothetical protein